MSASDIDLVHAAAKPKDNYRWYAVGVIWAVLLCRFTDQSILAILLEPIRKEFNFSDTQLGLLGGAAFALLYGLVGLPVGRLADRFNRRNIIAASVMIWSAVTAMGAAATGFVSLFLSRVGVGVAEAGGTAPSFSLLADYFPKRSRSTALALASTSTPLGIFVAYLVGGWVSQYWGWRAALLVVGLPGVLLALLVWLTLREPERGVHDVRSETAKQSESPPFLQVMRHLVKRRSYLHLVLANCALIVGASGSGTWIASFFMRSHGMSSGEIGTWLALVYGIGGTAGVIVGGTLADRLAKQAGDHWYAKLPAIATAAILPFSFFVYLWPDPHVALLVHTGTAFLMHAWIGPTYGTIQNLAEPSYRATAAAVNLLVVNVVAVALGPFAIGWISDAVGAVASGDSLRYSILATVCSMYTLAAVLFWVASRTLPADLALTETRMARGP